MPQIAFELTGDLSAYSRTLRDAISLSENANREIERLEVELASRRKERATLDQQIAQAGQNKMTYNAILAAQSRIEAIDKETVALKRNLDRQVSDAVGANTKIEREVERSQERRTRTAAAGAKKQVDEIQRAEEAQQRQTGRLATGGFRGAVRAGLQGTGLPLPFVTGGVASIAGGIAGAGAALVLRKSISEAMEYSKGLLELQREIGGTLQATVVLNGQSEKFGVTTESLKNGILALKQATSSNREEFAKLGIPLTDARGNARDLVDVLADLRQRLSQMPSETERYQAAQKILGSATSDLLPFLSAEQGELDKVAAALGKTADKTAEAILRARDAEIRFKQVGDAIGGFLRDVGSALISPFTQAQVSQERINELVREGHNILDASAIAQREANEARVKGIAAQEAGNRVTVEGAASVDTLTAAYERLGIRAPESIGKATGAIQSLQDAVMKSSTRSTIELAKVFKLDDAALADLLAGLEDVVGQGADQIGETFRQRLKAKIDQAIYEPVRAAEDAFKKAAERIAAIDEQLQRQTEKGAGRGPGGLNAGELAEQTRLMQERESAIGQRRVEIEQRLAELRSKGTEDVTALSAADLRQRTRLMTERAELVAEQARIKPELERLRELYEYNRAIIDRAEATKARVDRLPEARADLADRRIAAADATASSLSVAVDVTSSDGSLAGANRDLVAKIATETFRGIVSGAGDEIRRTQGGGGGGGRRS